MESDHWTSPVVLPIEMNNNKKNKKIINVFHAEHEFEAPQVVHLGLVRHSK